MLNAIGANVKHFRKTRLAVVPDRLHAMETFKERMRRIRLRAGFTSQGKAAAAIGCERGTVGMWEAPSSNVQAVGAEWLFAVARAYQVRPEWINKMRDKDDGYPYSVSTAAKPVSESPRQSHPLTIDPDILHDAITLLVYDEEHAGEYTPRAHAARLADLYARVAADGGRLSDQHNNEFIEEVQRRSQGATKHDKPAKTPTRRPNH